MGWGEDLEKDLERESGAVMAQDGLSSPRHRQGWGSPVKLKISARLW